MRFSRRDFLLTAGAASVGAVVPARYAFAEKEPLLHGLSSFGDLALPPDFKNFPYADPAALKGGVLALAPNGISGNQAFDTFNTLNMFSFKGQGAAGLNLIFDTLMTGSGNEPDACYGLVARGVTVSPNKLTYRFFLRPEARFHDGSPLTAEDVAFSLETLKNDEGTYPTYRLMMREMVSAVAEQKDIVRITFSPSRARDLHLIIAQMPIFSKSFYTAKKFSDATMEPPLGSSAYRVGKFEQGRFIEYERVADYWAKDLPVNVGLNNFDRIRYEYFRDRQVAFEAFKSGLLTFQQESTSRNWATGYNFPAIANGRVKKESIDSELPTTAQGWRFNLRRDKFKDARIREAIALAFDFEWTNKFIMYSSFKRTTSYFENSQMKAQGLPSPQELALLEPFRKDLPEAVFGEAYLPPVSDGSGTDRNLLKRANDLLMVAGCKRDGKVLRLPSGEPFTIEFFDFSTALQPHTGPFLSNLQRLGIEAKPRVVDAAQYQERVSKFDFDIMSVNAGGSLTPGDSLRLVYGSRAAATPGSLNYCGIAHPAVDAMLEKISNAHSRAELDVACRTLDRILRAEQYWVPMWYLGTSWIAAWDMYDRPANHPRFDSGAPMTWWVNPEKAKKIGKA